MESRKQIDEIEELELQIERLKNSTQENSREELAKAQVNLGVAFVKQGHLEKAIQAWESIKREDFPDAFAKAQGNLGNTFKQQGNVEKAIQAWESIKREDSPKVFATAKFNLGNTFKQQGNVEKAIQVWESMKREDSPEVFATAQFNLGNTFKQQGNVEKAIQAWESIKREDYPEQFAQAQFNLGNTFKQQGNVEKAIQAWESIKREDSPEVFARAQVNLGATFDERGDVEKAIQFWESLKREDSPEQFAKAQFNLGVTFKQQGETEKAIQVWKSIKKEDAPKQFAKAQFSLGVTFYKENKIKEAVKAFLSIQKNDKLYLSATTILLLDLVPKLMKSYSKNKDTINLILENRKGDYRCDIWVGILKLDGKVKRYLLEIFSNVNKIQELLKISWVGEDYEAEIAHYTTPTVGFIMLDNTPSKFRLNTIKGVNDPEEGKVLYRYLEQKIQNDEPLIPFISCFTFNHDSLNQFRLYGKDSGREASGISLVISKDKFFNQDGDIYSSINSNQSIQKESLGSRVQEETARYIHTLSLYRCIYLDPYQKSDELYLKVSHRDEWTFYRENSDKVPSSRWKEYQEQIGEIENNVRDNLEKIKDILKEIKEMDNEDAINIAEKIILPLRYLIKHAAFREEQECRIIYVSDVCDEKIQVDNKNEQMYIEYGCDLKDVIHKIYLSPGADKYKDHFRRILKDKEGKKVISSTNPFRIK